jgi:tetratricopeptide (TPR) repeat protein
MHKYCCCYVLIISHKQVVFWKKLGGVKKRLIFYITKTSFMKISKTIFFIFIVLLLIYSNALAQTPNYLTDDFEKRNDSLIEVLKKHPKHDSNRVKALEEIYVWAVFLSQKKKVLKYVDEAIYISRNIKFTNGLHRAYYWMAVYYKSSKNQPIALSYLDSIQNIKEELNDKYNIRFKAMAEELKGNIFFINENYYTSLNHFIESCIEFI